MKIIVTPHTIITMTTPTAIMTLTTAPVTTTMIPTTTPHTTTTTVDTITTTITMLPLKEKTKWLKSPQRMSQDTGLSNGTLTLMKTPTHITITPTITMTTILTPAITTTTTMITTTMDTTAMDTLTNALATSHSIGPVSWPSFLDSSSGCLSCLVARTD